jgi:ribosomal protein L11 methyltransferase
MGNRYRAGMNTYGRLEVVLDRKAAGSFCEWVREHWSREPVSLEMPQRKQAVVDIYFDTPEEAAAHRRCLPQNVDRAGTRSMACHEKEWTTFWRHHFHTQDIGRRLRIVPVWEKTPDRKRINLRMDPGLSFGTGGHFTTRFCLEELESACEQQRPRSLLDAGTGSGILAIAAARLGVPHIDAFDYDPICIDRIQHNMAINRLKKDRIRYYVADVLNDGWCRRSADIVCANILTTVLIEAADGLWAATKKRLLLTGIRECEGDRVANAFLALGAREIRRDGDGEWCGIVMERASPRPKRGKRRTPTPIPQSPDS